MSLTRYLSAEDWEAAWTELPAAQREAYWHPGFCEASARWEQASAQCLLLDQQPGRLLYPFLRHPIVGYDALGKPGFDVQSPYGYGGPLFAGPWSPEKQLAALAEVREVLRDQGAVAEFVRCHTAWTDPAVLAACDYRVIPVRTNVECDVSSEGDFTEAWTQLARRNLRKARNSGLRASLAQSAGDWEAFIQLYHLTFQRVGMAPFYRFDADYFERIRKLPATHVACVLVEAPEQRAPVAGSIVLFGGRVAHYHLGGSDLAHRDKRPNEFLFWAMADEARRRGCRTVVWGGGLSNDPGDTLFKFKTHFGGIQKPAFIAGRVLDKVRFDELCAEWTRRNPARAHSVNMFLKYRA